jgi:PTS system cellobiose-specific IIB component
METVLIVCGAGASSTFLASRIRKAAKADGIALVVEAGSQTDVPSRLDGVDILLVGSHLAPSYDSLASDARDAGVRAALLPPTASGPGGAEAALDLVRGLARSGQSANPTLTKGTAHA